MGSLLNFIFDKSSDEQNGPWETCHRGPIINEIIRENEHSYTENFEFKEGFKNLIVFEFTSVDNFTEQYEHKDKLLELKSKGGKIVFSCLSDPFGNDSFDKTKDWWEELDPIIIGATPSCTYGFQFDYFVESTIKTFEHAFYPEKNELGYISEKPKQNQLEFFRSNYFLCFNRQIQGKYHRERLFYDYFKYNLGFKSCFSFLNKFHYEQIDTIHDPKYVGLWDEPSMRRNITDLPIELDTHALPPDKKAGFYIGNTFRHDLYQNSNIHIVTETSFDELFLSEKILRPIFMYQPFIVLGPKGILKQLRSHGFKTFGEFWDESYDDIDDPKLRYEKVLEIILKIKDMDILDVNDLYSKARSVVVHNHQHISKIPTDTLQKKFIEIENEW